MVPSLVLRSWAVKLSVKLSAKFSVLLSAKRWPQVSAKVRSLEIASLAGLPGEWSLVRLAVESGLQQQVLGQVLGRAAVRAPWTQVVERSEKS